MSEPLRLRLYSSSLGLYLTAEGRLDGSTVNQVTTAVDLALLRLKPARITVDLSAVHYLDVAGVATLIACRRDARARGATLTLAQPSSHVRATVLACGAGVTCSASMRRQRPLSRGSAATGRLCAACVRPAMPAGSGATNQPADRRIVMEAARAAAEEGR